MRMCLKNQEPGNPILNHFKDIYPSRIVHQAPGFGEDDLRVCLLHKVIEGEHEGKLISVYILKDMPSTMSYIREWRIFGKH